MYMSDGRGNVRLMAIVGARDSGGPYRDIADLRARGGLSPAHIERLASADAFTSLGLTRRQGITRVRVEPLES